MRANVLFLVAITVFSHAATAQITPSILAPSAELLPPNNLDLYVTRFADLDADGDLDFISTVYDDASGDDHFYWSRNLGGGSFSQPYLITTLSSEIPDRFEIADFDGDGFGDVVGDGAAGLFWLRNLGGNGFAPRQSLDPSPGIWQGVDLRAVEDINGDGFMDIVLHKYYPPANTDMLILLGTSSMTTWTHVTNMASPNLGVVERVKVVDMDADGDFDIVYTGRDGSSTYEIHTHVIENTGASSFAPGVPLLGAAVSPNHERLSIGELNGDGLPDIVILHVDSVHVFQNLGGLSFSLAATITDPLLSEAEYLNLADLNEDGLMDIVYHEQFSTDGLYAIENTGNMTFDPSTLLCSSGPGIVEFWAFDMDGDDGIDLVTVNEGPGYEYLSPIYYRNLGGSFAPPAAIDTSANGPQSVATSDIDGDGLIDALYSTKNDGRLSWSKNQGGVFGTPQVIDTFPYFVGKVLAVDLDNDGDPEAVLASRTNGSIYTYENLGNGSFGSRVLVTDQADSILGLQSADVDGDGDMDLLSASPGDHKIAWYQNDGSGSFGAQQIISTNGTGASSVKAGDLDGDGDLDIAATSQSDGKVVCFLNQGGGVFAAEQIITSTCVLAQDVELADVDGDGDLDAVTASYGSNRIAWHENNGQGVFGTEAVISNTAYGVTSLHSVDHDQDGDMEIFAALRWVHQVAWWENLGSAAIAQGQGAYSSRRLLRRSSITTEAVTSADINNDGLVDIVGASYDDNNVQWYRNRFVTPGSAVGLPEDFFMLTLINGAGDPFATAKTALPNNYLNIELQTPHGTFMDAVPFILGQVFDPTQSPPIASAAFPNLLVEVTSPLMAVLLNGSTAGPLGNITLGPAPLSISFAIPAGLTGFAVRLQGLAYLPSAAANGFFATSHACDLTIN